MQRLEFRKVVKCLKIYEKTRQVIMTGFTNKTQNSNLFTFDLSGPDFFDLLPIIQCCFLIWIVLGFSILTER